MGDDMVYINFPDGVKRVMNNVKLYTKLLAKFKADTNLDDLEAAIAAGDMEKAKTAAHTIKGVAANLSLTELFNQSLELETQIKAGSPKPEQMETVKAVFDATMKKIEEVTADNG